MMFSQAPQLQAPFMHVGSALTGGLQLQMAYNQGSYMQQQYQPQQPTMVPTMVMTPNGPMMMMVPSPVGNLPSHFGPPGYQHMGMFPSTGISGGRRGTGQTTSASQRGGFISGGGFTPSSSSNTTRYSFKR
jgi:hypothetical protein